MKELCLRKIKFPVMKKIIAFFYLLFIVLKTFAQTNNYAIAAIPDSLKKDANVVLREEYIKFTLKDINSAKYQVHDVFTILNEQGKSLLHFQESSDKFEQLEDAEIKVYDALGVKQKTYSKKDMSSEAISNDLVPDGKTTFFSINAPGYPFTVEINYTKKYNGLFVYPGDYFQNPGHSIQQEVFDVEVPSDLSIRYKMLNCNYQPVITHNGNKDFYHWEVKNLVAYKIEKHIGASDNFQPMVLLGPNKFQLDEYDGDMSSWKNFGAWYNKLYSSTVGLPDERKLFYRAMVKNATTDKEKAKILYTYMQNNMRYVSIQLGIGGLRPFKASFVDEKKYGDCKALSNYLKSALNAVDVKANVVIIHGGMTPRNVMEDFPAHYFNHVILCIPQPKDSIWLECTSNTLPFDELGPFTENRKGMMITDSGGVLVNTPISYYKNNTESFLTTIETDTEGGAKATVSYQSKGEGRDNLLMGFHDMKDEEKRKYFISGIEWKQPDVMDITTGAKTENPYLIKAKMEYEKIYAFNAGNKYFFEPRLHPVFDEDIPETEKRERDYYFTYPYQSSDTTVYHFSNTFTIETLPKDKLISYPFAAYNCSYKWDAAAHTLTTIALLQIKERIVKAADYLKLLDFKGHVVADSNEKIVMKKE